MMWSYMRYQKKDITMLETDETQIEDLVDSGGEFHPLGIVYEDEEYVCRQSCVFEEGCRSIHKRDENKVGKDRCEEEENIEKKVKAYNAYRQLGVGEIKASEWKHIEIWVLFQEGEKEPSKYSSVVSIEKLLSDRTIGPIVTIY